jgi:hypothetical protein
MAERNEPTTSNAGAVRADETTGYTTASRDEVNLRDRETSADREGLETTGNREGYTREGFDGQPEREGYDTRTMDRDGDGVDDRREGVVDRDGDGVDDRNEGDSREDRRARRDEREGRRAVVRDHVERQRDSYGGFQFGAAFFGWLSANGLTVLLLAIASAAGVALGLTKGVSTDEAANSATDTLGLAGAIVLLVIIAIGYFAGGYVAGRMARFDGARQGVAVWIIGVLVTVALAVAGAVFGSEYNVLSQLNLPRIPVDEGDAANAGIIALVAVLLVTLFAAIAGGKVGERYHRKVDRAGVGI